MGYFKGLLLGLLVCVASGLSPSTHLTSQDRVRLAAVLDSAWSLTDLAQVLYGVSVYKHLGLAVANKEAVCAYVQAEATIAASLESLFLAASAGKALDCPVSASAQASDLVNGAVSEGSSAQELYHAVGAAGAISLAIDSPKALRSTLQALRKDDSVLSLGYAFHIGAQLEGDVSPLFERIEDAVVQADEVDGRMLQFEGGLSITALVLNGAYKLSERAKRPPPIKPEQAVKFANYLISRKSVQMGKGVFYLLEALQMLTNNPFHVPVSLTLASPVAVSSASPRVLLRVTDLMGNTLGPLTVQADKVWRVSDGGVLVAGEALGSLGEGLYELDVLSLSPQRGFYKLSLSAHSQDQRLVGHNTQLTFKVLTAVSIGSVEAGTADSDHSTAPRLLPVAFPDKLAEPIAADQHQRVIVRFALSDDGRPTQVHQAFVKLTHLVSKREIIFVAEGDANGVYRFDMDVTNNAKDFGAISGRYSLELIIGDASISNPTLWHLADLDLTFPEGAEAAEAVDYTYKARPEISHVFRSPDPRPASVVSLAFTGLCLTPLLLLLAVWLKLGVNLSNFPLSLSSISFHLSLGGILGLFLLFWLQLDMFTTLRYLLVLGLVSFFSGNSMLASIAASRKEA